MLKIFLDFKRCSVTANAWTDERLHLQIAVEISYYNVLGILILTNYHIMLNSEVPCTLHLIRLLFAFSTFYIEFYLKAHVL